MFKFVPYALATVCFAASTGGLALWGLNLSRTEQVDYFMLPAANGTLKVQTCDGTAVVWLEENRQQGGWHVSPLNSIAKVNFAERLREHGRFGKINSAMYFPLWYPPLGFASAAIGFLRLGRRFTLRSAIIATTVVAGLLGITVAM